MISNMPIQPKKFRESPQLQEEVVELEKKLIEKKQELARKKEVAKHDKELIKEIIREKVEVSKPLEKPEPTTTSPALPVGGLPTQKVVIKKARKLKGQQKERQIKLLADLAFDKGVIHATEVAKKIDDPYILDEFHDTLVDELYNYLVEQGKLKEI